MASSWGDCRWTWPRTRAAARVEQVAVGDPAAGGAQGLAQEVGEGPAGRRRPRGIPWPPRRRGRRPAARAGRRRPSRRGGRRRSRAAPTAGSSSRRKMKLSRRPRPPVGRRPPDRRLGQLGGAGARAGVAAVQDHDHVGPVGRDLGDELGQLLVGQVPGALGAAVVEHERLVEVVRLDPPELLGGRLLRAMAAIAEQGDVLRAGPAEVLAEGPDDRALALPPRSTRTLSFRTSSSLPAAGIDPRPRGTARISRMSLTQPRSLGTGGG